MRLIKRTVRLYIRGYRGAYSYAAMINFFGKDVDNFNVPTWRECMEAVKQGKADYAVLSYRKFQCWNCC